MSETFDVGFEKYIIFHRGVQQMEFRTVDGTEHLFIIYQDGQEQDLGDPYGDTARAAQAAAEAALASAREAEATAVAAKDTVNETYDAAIAAGEAAQAKYEEATEKAAEAAQSAQEATAKFDSLETTAIETIQGISGIVEDPNTHEFSVDFPETVPEGVIDNIFGGDSSSQQEDIMSTHVTLKDIYDLWNNLKSYSIFYGVCNTAAAQRTKTVAMPVFTLKDGIRITVYFPVQNTAIDGGIDGTYITLNVNGTGAKRVWSTNGALTGSEYAKVLNGFCDFIYDGTNWVLVSFQGGGWNHIIYSTEAPPTGVTYDVGTIWLKKKEAVT